jgi:mono/diheme cytochrome c family protein
MLQRLIFEKIEQRILAGTVAFLAIMVLVGWIAINEGGRMQAFEEQYLARSIERGATLFNANCSTCHGPDGRGLAGRAPALNSPYLFGHNFLAELDREILALTLENNNTATTPERRTENETRLGELNAQRDALISQIMTSIANIPGDYDPARPARLGNLNWSGSARSFIYTTLVHGRPTSLQYWNGQQMVAWGQQAGGPLRSDQLDDLTNFILNYDRGSNWTLEDLVAVKQFPITPIDSALAGPPRETIATGDQATFDPSTLDLAAIDAELANYTGDPQSGQTLYNGALGCSGCHLAAAVAPPLEGTWTRVLDVRLQDAANAGLTGEQYVAHSILYPGSYLAPGAPYIEGTYPNVMLPNFAVRITYQELADLVAFIKTHDEPLP